MLVLRIFLFDICELFSGSSDELLPVFADITKEDIELPPLDNLCSKLLWEKELID